MLSSERERWSLWWAKHFVRALAVLAIPLGLLNGAGGIYLTLLYAWHPAISPAQRVLGLVVGPLAAAVGTTAIVAGHRMLLQPTLRLLKLLGVVTAFFAWQLTGLAINRFLPFSAPIDSAAPLTRGEIVTSLVYLTLTLLAVLLGLILTRWLARRADALIVAVPLWDRAR